MCQQDASINIDKESDLLTRLTLTSGFQGDPVSSSSFAILSVNKNSISEKLVLDVPLFIVNIQSCDNMATL